MTTIDILEVGGFVRDELLGIRSKDRDCTVVISGAGPITVEQGFTILRDHLVSEGFTIFVETPEHATIRAHPPERGALPADFVLARREGPYSDGRRPDWVEIGTLADDLDRRDFTVNALARRVDTGEIIDRHDGITDLHNRVLRFVGDPAQRIREDALRVVRALRFVVTKGFTLDPASWEAINDDTVPELLAGISEERRDAELRTAFDHAATLDVVRLITSINPAVADALFAGRVRLTSTLKKGGTR
jgi:tRNA nucleotidyltransferase/poly(A) polymerase